MSIKTDVSLPYESKYGYTEAARLRVVSAAPDSKDHALCREFYRGCDQDAEESGNPNYRRYDGWMPTETVSSIGWKRYLLNLKETA